MKTNSIYMAVLAAMFAASANAQNTYDMTNLMSQDLDGTARYVGMGGAMNALGADISTMQSNPAGIGLMRKSDISFSGSLNTGDTSGKYLGHGDDFMSFDQAGVVFTMSQDPVSSVRYINFGFNYHRNKAYTDLFTDRRNLSGLNISQTYQMQNLNNSLGDYSTMANIGYNSGLLAPESEGSTNYIGIAANEYSYRRYDKGYNAEYDISMAINIEDQFYLGATIGLYDLSHETGSVYSEENSEGGYDLTNFRKSSGSGVDLKLGTIIRPVEDNPFRLGISVSTPIWYNMSLMEGQYSINVPYVNSSNVSLSYNDYIESFDYQIQTPWKFGVSAATTVGSTFAIDAEYEYEDWSSMKLMNSEGEEERVISGMNGEMLKGVSTFKIGAEYKFLPKASFRVGYNYVSPQYDEHDYLNLDPSISNYGATYSDVTDYSTYTAYTNQYAINRLTFGLGFKFTKAYLDLAYQYSQQKGEFYAFDDGQSFENRDLIPTKVNNKRSQILVTLGFKF